MMKTAAIVILLAFTAAILHTLFFGESRQLLSSGTCEYMVAKEAPFKIDLRFEAQFDEITGMDLILPAHLRRSTVQLELLDEAVRFQDEEPGSRSSQRSFLLSPPVSTSEKKTVTLRLSFDETAAPPSLEDYYSRIMVVVRYTLDYEQALVNFSRFKPLDSPAWVAAILFAAYLAAAVFLTGSLGSFEEENTGS